MQGDIQRRADDYFNKAQRLRRIVAQYDSSNFYYQKAGLLYAQAANWRKYLMCHMKTGENLERKADYDKAMKHYEEALKIGATKFSDTHPDINLVDNHVARLYSNIGVLHSRKGDYDKAIAYCNKAIAVWSQARSGQGISDEYSAYDFDCSYGELGNICRIQGDYDNAIAYYNKISAMRMQSFGEPHPVVANNFNDIGNLYSDKGDYDQALDYHRKALAIRLHFFDERHHEVAAGYHQVAKAYLDKGNFEKTLEFQVKALAIWLRIYGKKHPMVAESHQNLGRMCYQQENFEKALDYAQRSIIALVADFGDTSVYANPSLNNILAENELLNALVFKAEIFNQLHSSKTSSNGMNGSRDLKDSKMVLATYQLASRLIDKMRGSYKAEGSKLFLAGRINRVYEQAIQTALKLYEMTGEAVYQAEAFQFAEKGKAGVLLQSLQDIDAKKFAAIPDHLLEKEKDLRIDLAFYDTAIQKEKQKQGGDEEKIKKLESTYFSLKTEFDALVEDFEKRYPTYFDMKYRTQTASIREVQAALDDQTALVEYFVGEHAVYAFAIAKSDFDVIALPKASNLVSLVNAYFTSIKRMLNKNEYLKSSVQLYALLFKPIEGMLFSKKRLIVIVDGVLHYVPFEALFARRFSSNTDEQAEVDFTQLDYVIKRFDISYHYSATLYLNEIKKTRAEYQADSFAGFAPVFSPSRENGYILAGNAATVAAISPEDNRLLVTRDGNRLVELKYSEMEIQTILKMFGDKQKSSVGYFHQEASEENFKSRIDQYKYVHVSTHGFMNEDKPQLSGLAFSQPRNSTHKEDGMLYAAEAYNLDLGADLVVLSSCESGMGKLVKGEGLMTLTRGFLYSGAKNVLVSLWKVFDEHTSQLMIEFYKQMLAGKSYSAALREAKLKMIANPNTAFPASWASFVLIGA